MHERNITGADLGDLFLQMTVLARASSHGNTRTCTSSDLFAWQQSTSAEHLSVSWTLAGSSSQIAARMLVIHMILLGWSSPLQCQARVLYSTHDIGVGGTFDCGQGVILLQTVCRN